MPRNVRNFWIDLDVDGRRESIGTGPRRADGGFELNILVRNKGNVRPALRIVGSEENGSLELAILPIGPADWLEMQSIGMVDNGLVLTTNRFVLTTTR